MSTLGQDLVAAMKEVVDYAAGRKVPGMRVTRVYIGKPPNVKAMRRSLRMSQQSFAIAYRIPLSTLKNWEQGRRVPDGPAIAYLLAIKRLPKEIKEAIAR